jgi:guanylate kinase
MALDMCGAVAMKRHFPTAIIFIDKDKEELIQNVIEDEFSPEEKTLRILSIDAEKRNRPICDYVINNRNGDGAEQILALIEK